MREYKIRIGASYGGDRDVAPVRNQSWLEAGAQAARWEGVPASEVWVHVDDKVGYVRFGEA